MNYKILLAGLIVLLSIGIVFFVRINQNSDVNVSTTGNVVNDNSVNTVNANSGGSVNSSTGNSNQARGITSNVLSQHSSRSDCWIVFEGKVYDLTSFLPKHSGGVQAIAQYCGTNGFENAFIGQHGRSKISMLMKVGTLIGDFSVVGSAK